MITQERVKELFVCDNGKLIWRVNRGKAKKGDQAGAFDGRYFSATVDGKSIKTHRLIFLYHHRGTAMSKIVHIESCSYCPHATEHAECLLCSERPICTIAIPEWCPLPDSNSEEEKQVVNLGHVTRFSDSSLREAATLAERERCAVVARRHYMDTCKKRGLSPANYEEWLCAEEIRSGKS